MEEKQEAKKQEADKGLANLGYILLATGAVMQWGFDNPTFQDPGRIVMKAGGVLFVLFVLWPYVRKNRVSLLDKVRQLLRRGTKGIQPAALLHVRADDPAPVSAVMKETSGSQVVFDAQRGPVSLLPHNPKPKPSGVLSEDIASEFIGNALQLAGFQLDNPIEILSIESGPTLQTISFQLPPRLQLTALTKKKEDLANHLGCQVGFDVVNSRFKSAAAFVLPHPDRAFVYLRECMSSPHFIQFAEQAELPVVLGLDMLGRPINVDLARMPHLLVAGTTGSGKSVALNGIVASLLISHDPSELKMLMIDPKMVELSVYSGFPHLLAPPVTDMRRSALALHKIVIEMDRRYDVFTAHEVRNIVQYNKKNPGEKMPYIVVVVEEYADLMLVVGGEVEEAVQRIAQKARAAGIHLVMVTQRPSANVVTGIIKANIPSRISFKLQNHHDYRTVLDASGMPLMGYGDGIIMVNGGQLQRFQAACISAKDGEDVEFIEQLKAYWKAKRPDSQAEPQTWDMERNEMGNKGFEENRASTANPEEMDPPWDEDVPDENMEVDVNDEEEGEAEQQTSEASTGYSYPGVAEFVDLEALYKKGKQILLERGFISADILKHQLSIPYVPANRIVTRLDEEGLLGPVDFETMTRPFMAQEISAEHQKDKLKLAICKMRSARVEDLRNELGIRKDTVLTLMQELVQDGFLLPPQAKKTGYTLAWSEDDIVAYLQEHGEAGG